MFGLSFLTPKIAMIAVVALAFLGLLGRERYATLKWHAAEAVAARNAAQRDEAIAANSGLAGQVESLTADAAAATVKAAADRRELATVQTTTAAAVAAGAEEIDHVATPADDIELPSLRAWFDRLRGGSADPHHPTAAGH